MGDHLNVFVFVCVCVCVYEKEETTKQLFMIHFPF